MLLLSGNSAQMSRFDLAQRFFVSVHHGLHVHGVLLLQLLCTAEVLPLSVTELYFVLRDQAC